MKKTISFFAVVAVIAVMAGALMWQRGREPEIEEAAPAFTGSERLIQRTEAEVVSVTFTGQGRHEVMLPFFDEDDRREWMWYGADYVLDTANARHKVRGMFALFSNQVVHEDVTDVPGLNLADFGLNPPYMTIVAEYDDGEQITLLLGSPTIDFASRFVMIEGDPALYTITRLNADRFLLGLEDLIEVSLPQWHLEAMTYVKIAQRGHDVIEFGMQPHHTHVDFEWLAMFQPFPGREVYHSAFVYRIFEHFSRFTIGDLVNLHPDDFSVYGLDEPSLEFVYHSHLGDVHLLFGDVFFREENDREVGYIYVKFAGRPHVFEALYEPASFLFDINMFQFIERFIALEPIVDVYGINVILPIGEFEIIINNCEDGQDIEPTINGIPVDDSDFRLTYRLLIALSIDSVIEPMTPPAVPLYTVRYILHDRDDIELRFFEHDANFLAVSENGEDIWYITNRRNFELFAARFRDLE